MTFTFIWKPTNGRVSIKVIKSCPPIFSRIPQHKSIWQSFITFILTSGTVLFVMFCQYNGNLQSWASQTSQKKFQF